ncbi:hypothetical protein, unlikely [Trypanosoma brucei brucei TREU927]|uniref:Uncharacterized protein n=1 Tax=Trypanosoma brucei brucei (strain 927/4 GUTat10.1) TaxID=185431 RepID=Q38E45_TRYB2|nr:hypothetical protein, unlikely [Trypanosoma brucei brucei TREU927]EAN76925.1 hypothetical protein, unlikely [Trypanosoma brucei brucei TREU927]
MHLFIFMRMYIYLCARTKWKGGRKVNKGNWRVFVCLFVFVCMCEDREGKEKEKEKEKERKGG